jgi:hypothetical protein
MSDIEKAQEEEILALRARLAEACGLLGEAMWIPTGKVSDHGEARQLVTKKRIGEFLQSINHEWENINE